MIVTIQDPATAAVLAGTAGPEVEVYGPDGRLLGRFAPAPRPGMMFPEFGVTDEEMDRRRNDPNAKWVSGDEVMARLRSPGCAVMFDYDWLEATLDKLADLYITLDPSDRDRVAGAVERFNARLESEPLEVGESRVGGYRVAFLPLLMVTFHVDEAARRVQVMDVIRYGR